MNFCSAKTHVLHKLQSQFVRTASMIAIGVALAQMPNAARAEDDQTLLILEGYGGSVFGDSQPWVDAFNYFLLQSNVKSIRPDTVWGGGIGFITPASKLPSALNSGWDIGVFARFGLTNKESSSASATYPVGLQNILGNYYSFPYPYTAATATHQEEHAIVDFEARRDVGLGSTLGAKTTVKAGARFAYFNAATNTKFEYSCYCYSSTLTDNRTSRFIGAGPRIGFETVLPVSTNVTFDLAGAGALLFGVKNKSVRTVAAAGRDSIATSRFDVVPTLDASAALTFSPGASQAKFSVGVRAEAWFNVYDQTTRVTNNKNANRYQVTPFVRMIAPIGGVGGTASSTNAFGGGPFGGLHPVIEASASGGYLWRGGDDLNSSGTPNTEIDDFPLGGLSGLVALPIGANWLVQLEADGETAFDNDNIGGVPADDTYSGGYTIGGHVAYQFNQLMFGGFGGAGQTFFNDASSSNQDADHWVAGLEGRFLSPVGGITAQVGYLDSSADNSETLSDALFGRVVGQAFFNGGQTMLQAGLSYASGTQDGDDFLVNPTDVLSWDVMLEHQLEHKIGTAAMSMFLSYEGIRASEQGTSGGTDTIEDNTVMAGLKIRFGADTLYERESRTAPGLPNVARWLGSVPAVD